MGQMLREEAVVGLPVPGLPVAGDTGLPEAPVFSYSHPEQSPIRRRLIRIAERLSGQGRIEKLYRSWRADPGRDRRAPLFAEAVRLLGLQLEFTRGDARLIPKTGGLLVIANHPFGIADGLALGDLITRVRPDVKIMVHAALCQAPEARSLLLPVDFSTGAAARRASAETRKAAADWLDQGHVLVIFPAGGVATAPRPLARHAADPAWHPFVTRLALRAGVRVLPVWFHGQNSRLFQIVSHYSYPLRVALIFRETLKRAKKPLKLAVGQPVEIDPGMKAGLAGELRRLTYGLAGRTGPKADVEFRFPSRIRF
ncbi:lysophospholipid acyltransferase family protein [Pseudogemmobacter faecipullorum]|uniref:Lysophospholipid acyltransferase family protein n=1 Tax=Pseudogemmobacter faecipullorum TaxID=2755041 RepID=A0ABS8CGF0_9RHOB|nr:lysophospholipid acyltransferase family protein [Pseudogemmobacter faecipullorum]MCB5408464.1 lysophospholipid acyltransferase family protein [Pseudogemmobacter faecipullorum]